MHRCSLLQGTARSPVTFVRYSIYFMLLSSLMVTLCCYAPLSGGRTRIHQLENRGFIYPGRGTFTWTSPQLGTSAWCFLPRAYHTLSEDRWWGRHFCAGFAKQLHAIDTVPRNRRMGVNGTQPHSLPPTIDTRKHNFRHFGQ